MKTFFQNGEKSTFRISPDGNYFSYRADYKGKMNIFVQKVGDSTAVRVSNDTLRSIYSYFWKSNRIVYAQDIDGDQNFQLFSVKTDGTDLKALTPFPAVRSDVIDALTDITGEEKELIVQINKRVKEYFDPYLLNVETGALTLLYNNKENYDSWITDNNGIIRLASKTDGVNITRNYRDPDMGSFTPLLTTSFKDNFTPVSFDKDNKNIYVLSNTSRDKTALVEYDPVAKKELKELYTSNDYDLSTVKYDRKRQSLASVYWQAEKKEKHFFDATWETIQNNLDKKFEGYEPEIVSYDDARSKAIVATGNDRAQVRYYLYDFKTKETKPAANPYPWIEEKQIFYFKFVSEKVI
ncbi:MAG: hypothetical protein M9933_16490 [Chitinophagaceae bacterium]|nr:hypothetical protein [Chitinophagaceae bacterium]